VLGHKISAPAQLPGNMIKKKVFLKKHINIWRTDWKYSFHPIIQMAKEKALTQQVMAYTEECIKLGLSKSMTQPLAIYKGAVLSSKFTSFYRIFCFFQNYIMW
jgi:hypothetical protein